VKPQLGIISCTLSQVFFKCTSIGDHCTLSVETNHDDEADLQIRNGLISCVLPDLYFNKFFTDKIINCQ